MGRLNHHVIDNGDVEVHSSEYRFQSTSDSVLDPDTTLIKPIDDDEMYQVLELFHSDHDDDILDVDFQTIQDRLLVAL